MWLNVEIPRDPNLSRWNALEAEILSLNNLYAQAPWISFGNESKIALLLKSNCLKRIKIIDSRRNTQVDIPKVDDFFKRPAIEPIAYSSWLRFISWDLDNEWFIKTASLLTCERSKFRDFTLIKQPGAGLPGMKFAPHQVVRQWLSSINSVRAEQCLHPLKEAACALAIVILYHPLDNGNGRLSRVIFHAVLCNRIGIDAPFLALGPTAYNLAYRHARMIQNLALSYDWNAYFEEFYDWLLLMIEAERYQQSYYKRLEIRQW